MRYGVMGLCGTPCVMRYGVMDHVTAVALCVMALWACDGPVRYALWRYGT